MAAPRKLSWRALRALNSCLGMFGPRRNWGSTNLYSAGNPPSEWVTELLDRGFLVHHQKISESADNYKATPAGMRAAGLGPAAIERACNL